MNPIKKFRALLMGGSAKSVRAKKHVLLTIVLKAIGVLIGFLYFPLSLDYLGAVKFGIFLTLVSIVDWFLNFDMGISSGLRNKFGESVALGDNKSAVQYVSTAYFSLGVIILAVTFIFLILNYSLPWPSWLSIAPELTMEVKLLGMIIIMAFGIRFVAATIYEIFYALQIMAYVEFFNLITKALFLVLILIIPFIVTDSLLLFGLAKSLTFAIVPLIVGIYYFRRKFIAYRPSLKYVRKKYFNDIFSLGFKFFLIKISMLIIYQTNNILIAGFVSLEGVSQYEAAYKYLSIFMMLFVILTNQLWPSNLEAYVKGEFDWMKKSMRVVFMIWIITVFLASLMVLVAPWFYEFWLEESLQIPYAITLAVACSICLTTFVNMFNLVLNGTGKITIQMVAWIFAALINIPISLFFVKVLDLGIVGIILGTICSLIPLAILSPIQVTKILNQKDRGIWTK